MSQDTHSTYISRKLCLYIPGVLKSWQAGANSGPQIDGKYPVLETIMARAERTPALTCACLEKSLFALFGIQPDHVQGDLPVAALTRALDLGLPDEGWWLRADPVHLSISRGRLTLVDAQQLSISQAEADRLVAVIMEVFVADGWRLEAARPERWYLKPAQVPEMTTTPLPEAIAHDIHPLLPQGKNGKAWRTALNEVQILLHSASVNVEREKIGKLPINSLWFWGGGRLPSPKPVSWTQVWSTNILCRALTHLHGIPTEQTPLNFDSWQRLASQPGEHLVLLDDGLEAWRYGEQEKWAGFVQRLERDWLAPLLRALKHNTITSVTLLTDAGWEYSLTSGQARRWWRLRRAFSTYLEKDIG